MAKDVVEHREGFVGTHGPLGGFFLSNCLDNKPFFCEITRFDWGVHFYAVAHTLHGCLG